MVLLREVGLGVRAEAEQRVAVGAVVAFAGFDAEGVVGGFHAEAVGREEVRGVVGERLVAGLPDVED
ncbi:hypothetical protein ABTY00_38165 [Streptomyces microflavus]|uniref:hypothetical protein n=1 Tax=Streptomyces microflavus TaxID=1919 RepID=UPI0033177E9E